METIETQIEEWKQNKTVLVFILQEGNFVYSVRGYIKDFSEDELILQTENGLVQIINRKFIVKIREIK